MTARALGFRPLAPAGRTHASRLERVPAVEADAHPDVVSARLPNTTRATNTPSPVTAAWDGARIRLANSIWFAAEQQERGCRPGMVQPEDRQGACLTRDWRQCGQPSSFTLASIRYSHLRNISSQLSSPRYPKHPDERSWPIGCLARSASFPGCTAPCWQIRCQRLSEDANARCFPGLAGAAPSSCQAERDESSCLWFLSSTRSQRLP